MDFALTEEQRMIQDSAKRFVMERPAQSLQQRRIAGSNGSGDGSGWAELANHGFLAVGLPKEYGGFGGPTEIAIVCREFGRGPLAEPYVGAAVFAAQLIVAAGRDEQKATLLPGIVAGELRAAVAYREPTGIQDGVPPDTTAVRSGPDYIVTGRKCLVLGGADTHLLIVSAAISGIDEPGRYSLFLIDPRQPGVTSTELPLIDGSRCAEICFAKATIPASALLGTPGNGERSLTQALRYATLGACSEIAGAVYEALRLTLDHVLTRKQFGAPLSALQVVRAKVANMAIDCEMAWATICVLIASFQDPEQCDPAMTTAMSKVTLDEIGHRVCSEAVQLHGGMGLAEECGIGRYIKRAALCRALYGTAWTREAEYSRLLTQNVRAGASSRELP